MNSSGFLIASTKNLHYIMFFADGILPSFPKSTHRYCNW